MAKQRTTAKQSKPKRCICGATSAREHIQASVQLGFGPHPYTGPR